MKLLSKVNYKRLVIYVLLSFAMFIIGSWPVSALEMVYPNYEFDNQIGTTPTKYYGYDIPNRVNTTVDLGQSNNYVSIGILSKNRDRLYSKNLYFNDNPIISYTDNGNELSLSQEDTWFTDWVETKWVNSLNNALSSYLVISYHPAQSGSKGDTLDYGRYIDYDSYYSYSFYIEILNTSGNDDTYLKYPILNAFTTTSNSGQRYHSYCVVNNGEIADSNCDEVINIIESSNDRILLRYDIKFNSYKYIGNLGGFLFNNNGFTYCNNGCTTSGNTGYFSNVGGLYGAETCSVNNGCSTDYSVIGAFNNSTGKVENFKFRVSQPFNIVMWSTDSSLFCQENCWTQEDTNNNSWVEESVNRNSDFLMRSLFDLDIFNDMGSFQVIESIFDEFRELLGNNYNNACYSYNVPIFNTNIPIMCGYDFWSRNDISFFKSLWDMFWIGLVGFWVARSIYLKLLSLVDIDNGVVIDAKEVSTL